MNKTYALDQWTEVLTGSIEDTGICTQDKDVEGYLLTNGSNRSIKTGITPDNQLTIWMATNGGDVAMSDDLADATAWCEDMGDLPESKDERIRTGVVRLLDACNMLDERYAGNEIALECINWYRDKAGEVLDAC